jgi:hypothetical protein
LFGRWDRGQFFVDNPKTKKGNRRKVPFEELQAEIIKVVNFPQNELTAIERIQERGNLSVHFASLRIEGIKQWERDVIPATNRLLRNNPTPEGWKQLVEGLEGNAKIFVNAMQALDDLQDTSSILKTFFRTVKPYSSHQSD